MRNILDIITSNKLLKFSSLYQHISSNYEEISDDRYEEISKFFRNNFINSIKDKSFDYMYGNKLYEKIISSVNT